MIGRRMGLIGGAGVGVAAAVIWAYAIVEHSFVLFCCGSMLLGTATAFSMQYRFVAAESVTPQRAGRAISHVLLGSLGAALLAPQAAMAARRWLAQHEYAGSFWVVALLYALDAIVLVKLRPTEATSAIAADGGPALRALIREPMLRRAVRAGAVAFGVMSFVMTAAPVSMHTMSRP